MFLNPLLLFGLVLGAVPVIIHLLNKRRFRPVRWAAMEFLIEAVRRNSRRLQWRDLIMMAIRTLCVLSLALALARPSGKAGGVLPGVGQGRAAIVLLDASLSMGHESGDQTRLSRSIRALKRLWQGLPKGSWVALIVFGGEARSPFGEASQNPGFIERELDRQPLLTGGATHLDKAFRKAARLIETHPHFRAAAREVILVTDLQATSWDLRRNGPDFEKLLRQLSENSTLVILDAGRTSSPNLAIAKLTPSDPLVAIGRPVSFSAEIRNFGSLDHRGVGVQWFVDGEGREGEPAASRSAVDLAAGQATTVGFTHTFKGGGEHRVEVRLDPAADRLPADNRRGHALEVLETARFLLVDGAPETAGDLAKSETVYLRCALNPAGPEASGAGEWINVESLPLAQLAGRDLSGYQTVILSHLDSLDEKTARYLAAQVKGGMGLLIFLGEKSDPARLNTILGPSAAGLLPATILPPWGQTPTLGAALPPAKSFSGEQAHLIHPLMFPFHEAEMKPLLERIRIFRAFTLRPGQGEEVKPVAWYHDGGPAILEAKRGEGYVVLVPFPANPAWGNLSTQPVFPVLMGRVAQRLALGHRPERNLKVGEPIRGWVSLADQALNLHVWAPPPLARRTLFPSPCSDGRAAFECLETDWAGFYTIRLDRPGARPATYALNPDAEAESDLGRIEPDQIRRNFPGLRFQYAGVEEQGEWGWERGRGGREYWPWFFASAVLLLILETVLARLWAPKWDRQVPS